jgi:hypothetical protein
MTTRSEETAAVNRAFQAALAKQGAEALAEAVVIWNQLPADRASEVSAVWLGKAVHMILTRRERSRELGLAYYRLVRALRTGKTVGDKRRPEPKYVSIDKLRREFEALAASKPLPKIEDAKSIPRADRIEVDFVLDIDEIADRQDRATDVYARNDLAYLGPNSYKKAVAQEIGDGSSVSAADADKSREELRKKAGYRQASSAERHVLNGARSMIWEAGSKDKELIGFIRLSRTGTPCGWCAMLISRGAVYRGTQGSSAEVTFGDLDLYHDNCKCYAEPVYSEEQESSDPSYALNREYKRLWPIVTKGLGGKEALAAWRRYFREQQKTQSQSAQAA